jgi:hypothetical protein
VEEREPWSDSGERGWRSREKNGLARGWFEMGWCRDVCHRLAAHVCHRNASVRCRDEECEMSLLHQLCVGGKKGFRVLRELP